MISNRICVKYKKNVAIDSLNQNIYNKQNIDMKFNTYFLCFLIPENKINKNFVMHCFSSSLEVAKEIIKMDGYISLSGTVTFKNAKKTASGP